MISLFSTALLKLKKKIIKDGDFKEIAKGGARSLIVNLAGLGVGFLFVILFSRIYKSSTAEIYGQYVLITLLLRIASIITRFGTDTTMLKLTAAFATGNLWGNILEINRKLIRLLLVLGTVVTILVMVFRNQIGDLFKLQGRTVFIASFLIIPLSLGLYYSQSLRGLKKVGISTFLRSSALNIINFILLPLALIFVPRRSPEFNGLPFYTFYIAIVLTAIIGMVYWNRETKASRIGTELLYDNAHSKSLKQLFNTSYPLLLTESMIFIGTWIDQLLLGVLGDNKDVGIYNLCVKYTLLASLSFQAITTIAAPKFSELYFKNDLTGLARNVKKTTKTIFWATVPLIAFLFAFPQFLLGIFGPSFVPGWKALIILVTGTLVMAITGSVGTLLQMTGHQKAMQNILFITILFEIVLNIVLIPLLGVTGAAIASTICCCIQNFAMVFYINKHFGFNTIVKIF